MVVKKQAARRPISGSRSAKASRKKRTLPKVRRVVTGQDELGRSAIVIDEISAFAFSYETAPDFGAVDVWRTHETPVNNVRPGEGCTLPFTAEPPRNGSVCRIAQFPPDRTYLAKWSKAGGLNALSDAKHLGLDGKAHHASMHTTRTLDYAIVLEGEIYALMDASEVRLKKGDVLVQRGTHHGWSNRSKRNCVVCFVLIDALPIADPRS
jgi:hypothetical protein